MVSAEQMAAVKANIAAVRGGDVSKTAGDFFIYFFTKFPAHQNRFPAYKGQAIGSLASVGSWKTHTTNVVAATLTLVEKAGDAGTLAAAAKQTIADHVSRGGVNAQEYADVLSALVSFLVENLSVDKAAWEAATGATAAALKAAF